jgi:hypothetical protein
MDWPLDDPEFEEKELNSLFRYQPQRSLGVYFFQGDKASDKAGQDGGCLNRAVVC